MRCKDVREFVSDLMIDNLSPEIWDHLSGCPGCQAYLRNARLVQAGFRALAKVAAPEASYGFASRLVRQLGEWGEKREQSEFFENVGRRFVYATFALTLALLLALVLPPSGPVRSVASSDFVGLQADSRLSSQTDVIGLDAPAPHEGVPGKLSH